MLNKKYLVLWESIHGVEARAFDELGEANLCAYKVYIINWCEVKVYEVKHDYDNLILDHAPCIHFDSAIKYKEPLEGLTEEHLWVYS